jgi:acylphosphatase
MRRLSHIIIRGRVQGVSFRAWAIREAESRGLDGWVRNREDGGVEMIFAGHSPAIDEIILACRSGPDAALVTDVIELPTSDDPGLGFRIRS